MMSAVAAIACTGMATAQQQGTMTLAFGLGMVAPQSDTGVLAGADSSIDDDIRPTIAFEYFIRDNLGIELLAATPFEHTVTLAGLGDVGTTTHLPPTLSLNYHFPTGGAVTPFVSAGINYTAFLDTDAIGALAGRALEIEDSWGLALHAGVDFALSDTAAMRLDLRWIDIDADVTLDGAPIGTAEIDPLVFGIAYVMQF